MNKPASTQRDKRPEGLVELATALAMLVLAVIVLNMRVRGHRWTFDHHGHRIAVQNGLFEEVVSVDGIARAGTRVAGSPMTFGEHAVVLPDGSPLRVWVGRVGLSVGCRADDGVRLVFQSSPGQVDAGTETIPHETDARLVAARVLLTDIAVVDGAAASALGGALETVIAAETAARLAAAAHAGLGGRVEDTAALLVDRARMVEDALATIRSLHLDVVSDRTEDLDAALASAKDAVARVSAATEVERDARAGAVRAHRAAVGSGQRS